ncbi:unnamed protein product [Zymoseptoria tritici ST99CH_1A5]|uniref:Endo-1,3(4)-beta-glucanase 1 carbohydrate binding domain-containing protein n=3 Tax=Zymoseptoria tritici TaxID=1047171 RepID=A0A1X7RQQ0_ZYMT9|nr:unnamed protein product [Zymoseptoria tritici ST99CH_3D7]SMR50714.1 unnamed protein product [Zymoseptoria tritici ST99CH_1E4]SMR51655.1 unnamed protein product [Zymoseptoria tritici ST99CH_3D1]SMY23419.1 unnamed protein product [Zymoseptoria tritici ST99CH_1A5]
MSPPSLALTNILLLTMAVIPTVVAVPEAAFPNPGCPIYTEHQCCKYYSGRFTQCGANPVYLCKPGSNSYCGTGCDDWYPYYGDTLVFTPPPVDSNGKPFTEGGDQKWCGQN